MDRKSTVVKALSALHWLLAAWLIFQCCAVDAQTSFAINPPAAVARIASPCRDGTGIDFGTGSLVSINEKGHALVITNWHVIRDGSGQVEVDFPSGQRCGGIVLKADKDWDVAAILITAPSGIAPLPIAQDPPQLGEPITIEGYGSGQFAAARGHFVREAFPKPGQAHDLIVVDAHARHGDSGGPMLNARGEIAGMLFGADKGQMSLRDRSADANGSPEFFVDDGLTAQSYTVGPCCRRLRRLLCKWFPGLRLNVNANVNPSTPSTTPGVAASAPAAATYAPATGSAGAVGAVDPSPAINQLNQSLSSQLAAIKSELDSVAAGGATSGGLSSLNSQLQALAGQVGSIPGLNTQLQTLQSQINGQLATLAKGITPAAIGSAMQTALPALAQTASAAAPAASTLLQLLPGGAGLLGAGAVWLVTLLSSKKNASTTGSAGSGTSPPGSSSSGSGVSSVSVAAAVQPATSAASSSTPAAAKAAPAAPPANAPAPQNYVPYTDSSVNAAWQQAHAAIAKQYPGSVGVLQSVERMVPQILSGMNAKLVPE